jgi:hypothetical protein
MSSDHDDGSLRQAVRRKGSFLQTLRSVAWAFFGVRKSSEYERDVQQLNPIHLIIAGLLAAAIFIGVLILVVKWVVGGAAAA